jgi:SAM-dependent methyltransferase
MLSNKIVELNRNLSTRENLYPCPVCKGFQIKSFALYRSKSVLFKDCALAKCADCSMVFCSPMPSLDSLESYNNDYFSNAHGGIPIDIIARAYFNAIAKLRIACIKNYVNKFNLPISNVLEFGPGLGYFAKNWLEYHSHHNYFAVETDQSCHEELTKIGVNLVNNKFDTQVDLVVISHVLEHTPNPIDFLKIATLQLKSGGMVFIEVPCQDWAHKEIDEPHILFFEKKSMHKLLTDHGFVDIELDYFGQPISKLKKSRSLQKFWNLIRLKMIKSGFISFFSKSKQGMELIIDPLERAVISPFLANQKSIEPAWWLRVLARKV